MIFLSDRTFGEGSSGVSTGSSPQNDRFQEQFCDDDNTNDEPPSKKNRVHHTFNLITSFGNEGDALNSLATENCWSAYYTTNSEDGVRKKFRCNKVKYRAEKQCAKSCYLLYDSRSSMIHLFVSNTEHDHDKNAELVYEIAPDTKKSNTSKCLIWVYANRNKY